MRIGINALFMIPEGVGGTEIYLRELLKAFARTDRKNEYIIFSNKECFGTFNINQDNFSEVLCPIYARLRPARILWEQFILPLQIKKYKIDVLFSPGYVSPLKVPCKSIVAILDLNYYYFPEDFPKLALWTLKILVPFSAKVADKIITLSKHSSEIIAKNLRLPVWKVVPIYLAANKLAKIDISAQDLFAVRTKYGIKDKFILSVAASHPHKNLKRLIQAYDILKNRYSVDMPLVLVGFKGRGYREVEEEIKKLNLKNEIKFTGWITDKELAALYKSTEVFVFPSLHEGFGIPILEAMQFGVPVVSSNATSLPEVVGGAGLLFSPFDTEEMAERIYQVISNESLRNSLIIKGHEKVKEFSWEKTARETLDVFNEVLLKK